MQTGEHLAQAPFAAHVELLGMFLAHRPEIVERLQELLNAQRRPIETLQDRAHLCRQFEDCFFTVSAITRAQSGLRGQLEQARRASGFRPRDMPGMHNDLVDAGEMMIRGFHLWRQTRWPGRNGRARYAHTLFSLYVLRCLELLSLRLWDPGPASPRERLAQIQRVLDRLHETAPADQPVLLRDARWLLPLAQSPTTDDLAPYFQVAEQVEETLGEEDRIEIHKAGVQMAGGHLRSQLFHYRMKEGVTFDDQRLVLSSRNSNALDFAMLIQGLVPLLRAYEEAVRNRKPACRLQLASAICQGLSADPELFVNRLELLGAYSMIEHLFITKDRDGHVIYTPAGRRHIQLIQEYGASIRRVSLALYDDCFHFKPNGNGYSPYGVIYGFSSNLTEHMALKSLQPDTAMHFSLEDVFTDGSADKLAWVSGWRKLPHIPPHVQSLFDYPRQFAGEVFDRLAQALQGNTIAPAGGLFVMSADDPQAGGPIASLPVEYIGSSDPEVVSSHKAHPYDPARLLRDRQEGMFVVSYPTEGGWTAITKDILTGVLGVGRDVKIVGLPSEAAGALRLMCPHLVRP